jgi:hypothetical protein
MAEKNYLYFHLGLPKVASTFLQKELFPKLEGIEFHKKHDFKDYHDLVDQPLKQSHLFSDEKMRGLEEKVEEITQKTRRARFILLFRSHRNWLISRYKYYIRKHGHLRFEEYFDLDKPHKSAWHPQELNFRAKFRAVDEMSEGPTLVLTMDQLKKHPNDFVDTIEGFTGGKLEAAVDFNKKVNRSFSEKQLILLRKFNRWYPYQKRKGKSRFLNRLHYKYREFLLHSVAFLLKWAPESWLGDAKLIEDDKALARVEAFYAEDWQFISRKAEQCVERWSRPSA